MPHLSRTLLQGSLALGFAAPAQAMAFAQAAKPADVKPQDPGKLAAAAGQAPATKTACEVLDVVGNVGVRAGEGQALKKATKGMILAEGAIVQTSHNSAIQLKIGTAQIITIDKMTVVSIRQAVSDAGTERTRVDLPYGRVKFDITSTTVANDVRIQSPDATLAVKGTVGLIDSTPGFPTVAAGGQFNTGRFEVVHAGGQRGTVTSNESTTSDAPNPAQQAVRGTQIDTGAPAARSGDEGQVVNRATGGGQSSGLALGGGGRPPAPPPPPETPAVEPLFFVDQGTDGSALALTRLSADGRVSTLRSGADFETSIGSGPGSPIVGLALQPSAGGPRVLMLQNSGSGDGLWTLKGLELGTAGSVFTTIASSNDTTGPNLFGLATIGERIYASSVSTFQGTSLPYDIFEINPANSVTTRRMSLPLSSFGLEIGGDNARGSLYVVGSVGSSRGGPGFLGSTSFEVDPRNNFLLSVGNGFTFGATTQFTPPELTSESLSGATVTGVATRGNLLVLTLQSGPNRYFALVDPAATGATVRSVSTSIYGLLGGLAGEAFIVPPAPRVLAAANGTVDPFIIPTFAQMAFSQQAAGSDFFRQMVVNEIARTSVSPTACAAQLTLSTIGPFLSAHTNQVSGTGLSVNDYRSSLFMNNPCLGPGQTGTFPAAVYLDDAGNMRSLDLVGTTSLLRSGLSYAPDQSLASSGLAIIADPGANFRQLLRLEVTGSGPYVTNLLKLDLMVPDSVFLPSAQFTDPVRYSGLATIGTSIYTSGMPPATSVEGPGLYELVPGGVGSAIRRMSLPIGNDAVLDIAGSNQRGSVFTIGQPSPNAATGTLPTVFEVDPRNNYFRTVTDLVRGPTTVLGPGVDPAIFNSNSITQTGGAMIGDRLIVTVRDNSTGFTYFVQINPFAAGTAASPSIVRVSRTNFVASGLGSESFVTPPGPIALGAPVGNIDAFIDPLFAQGAFSQQAANALSFRTLVAREIDRTSVSPGQCFGAINFQQLGTILANHVNQGAGIGTSVFAFRNGLPATHPCRAQQMPGVLGGALYFDGNVLRQFDPVSGVDTVVYSGVLGVSPLSNTGYAYASGNATTPALLQLVSTDDGLTSTLQLSQLNLSNPQSGFQQMFTVSAPVRLGGLATLGGEYFTGGVPFSPGAFDPFQVLSINPGGVVFNGGFQVASAQLGALTGAPSRGSVFGVADFNFGPPQVGGLSSLGQVFEYDPRGLNLVNTFNFVTGPSTVIVGGINPSNITSIVGAAYINNLLVLSVTTTTGQRAFVLVNPSAAGTTADPTVVRISATPFSPRELAGESNASLPPPRLINPPTSFVDTRIGFQVNNISYEQGAVGAAAQMVRRMIAGAAQDTSTCVALGIFTSIDGIVQSHVSQSRGIGQSVFDFLAGLPFDHPCQINQSRIDYIGILEDSQVIQNVSINNDPTGGRATQTGFTPVTPNGGAGLVVSAGIAADRRAHTLYRLESVNTGSGFTSSIYTLDLNNPNSTSQTTTFQNVPTPMLTGLATIGNELFASGGVGPSGGMGIVRVNLANGTITPVIDAPFLGLGTNYCSIGSSNERGTIFVPAMIGIGAALPRFSIVEFDPRNNLMTDAYTIDNGRLLINSDTVNTAGLSSLSQIDGVDGIAYNQGVLTLAASVTGSTVVVSINTFGNNSPGHPAVRRVEPLASRRFGLAGQLPVQPPSPAQISNPAFPGGLDLRGLSAQFADLAYTTAAYNTGVPTAMIRSAIIASARDPSGCGMSTELNNNLGPIVGGNVNLRAGVARSVTQFRQNIPGNHPCQP